MVSSLLEKLKACVSVEVPDDIAACEFDCRKLECQAKDWATCPRRLRKEEALKQFPEALSQDV